MPSRHAQKSAPAARPRSARWKAWLCAFTNPGRLIVRATPGHTNLVAWRTRTRSPRRCGSFRTRSRSCASRRSRSSSCSSSRDQDGPSWPAGVIFALAAITDQLDGWLARRWRVESAFGKVADPLADRLMIDVAVVLLVVYDRLPWVALIILLRDLLLVGGYKLVVPRGYEFEVSLLGKIATWGLYASLVLVLVTARDTWWPLALFWISLALAVAPRSSTSPRRGGRCGCEGGRDGGRGRNQASPSDVEPAEADGPDRRQAVHGACARPAPQARADRGRRDARLHAAGDPHVLRRRRVARPGDGLLRRRAAARHRGLRRPRQGAAHRYLPRHLRRRPLRRRPHRAGRDAPREGRRGDDRPQVASTTRWSSASS